MKGTGLDTGDRYQGTGVSKRSLSFSDVGFPFTFTAVESFRIVGRGEGNDFFLHVTEHTTVNANGETSSQVLQLREECR